MIILAILGGTIMSYLNARYKDIRAAEEELIALQRDDKVDEAKKLADEIGYMWLGYNRLYQEIGDVSKYPQGV